MRTIFKYILKPKEVGAECHKIQTYKGYEILSVGIQGDDICVWIEVETSNAPINKTFEVFGTGHIMQPLRTFNEREFIGTVFMSSLVFHIYHFVEKS